MKSQELRRRFFDYFKKHKHEEVASSSLIPAQDPTLLFTNAGMNQFKDALLGKEKRSYTRAVSIQKCVRAGGKHNDLDVVGFTQRHLTFFEMMGNFSFGDYFKHEAIAYAWNFLTKELGINAANLYVSVHETDDDAYAIWHQEIGLAQERIFKLQEDNFWQMGDVGPCGPCTEIFVDRGPEYGCKQAACDLACDCDRFLEVWNVVFMQYNRLEDGTDVELEQKGIDTGMGLERLCVIMQGKDSVFEVDVFAGCIAKTQELTGHTYQTASADVQAAFNVLADHVRSSTFLINDGCAPSNDGRGYVLRKIIRRAALFAQKLTNKNIFPELAKVLIAEMKDVYPDLVTNQEQIIAVLRSEIERFADNLVRGKAILEGYLHSVTDKQVSGKQAFTLYDTYGFPLEVTQLIAQEQGFAVDVQGFDEHMLEQKKRSGKKMKTAKDVLDLESSMQTEFTGYSSLQEEATILGMVVDDQQVSIVDAEQEVWLIPDKTPFYVECGGQVNDQGVIVIGDMSAPLLDLKKVDDAILVKIQTPKQITIGDVITQEVDQYFREHTMKNHTATHLLQAAMRQILGPQVKQAGSVVTRDYLRFDYTYHKALDVAQIKKIEDLVNEKIWENIPVSVEHTTYKDATSRGVIAFFGDKYNPDDVRAVMIPDFSAELCGGTHVKATGDIGMFKIVEETALAAGQRRIVALTGGKALQEFQEDFAKVKQVALALKTSSDGIIDMIERIQNQTKELTKEVKQLKQGQWKAELVSWKQQIEEIRGIGYLYLTLQGYAQDDLRNIAQALQQHKPGLYVLINTDGAKCSFLVSLDKSCAGVVDLQEFKGWLQEHCGLRGGGSAVMIQGGGKIPDKECHGKVKEWLCKK